MVHSRLLSDIEQFIERTGVAPTRFGQLAIGDRHLVRTLRAGRRVWPETEARIRQFMRDYRRKQGTVRPQRSVAEAGR